MSLILQIVSEEKNRIEKMIIAYEEELLTLPKGVLVIKNINGKQYYYLQYRLGKKTISAYIGNDENKALQVKNHISRRKQVKTMLKYLRKELLLAHKITGE